MDTQTLEKLKAIIKNPDFDEDVKNSQEDAETLFPRLLKQRGMDLTWEELREGLELMFSTAVERENLDGELTDEALEMVSGGLTSACYDLCMGGVASDSFCDSFCGA